MFPLCCCFISVGHLQHGAFAEGSANNLQTNGQSVGGKSAADTQRGKSRHVERRRAQRAKVYSRVTQADLLAVGNNEPLLTLFDGRRGHRAGRRHEDVAFPRASSNSSQSSRRTRCAVIYVPAGMSIELTI